MALRPLLLGLLTITLFGSACRKSEVTSYRVPKEKDPELPAAAAAASPAMMPPGAGANDMAATAVPTASGQALTWTAPATWKTKPPAPMRKATFAIPGDAGSADAELSITAFPGDVGGELANLNRWRGQKPFELPPVSAAELESVVTRREHDGLKFGLVELESKGARLLGAWVPFAGSTWFFKFSGPDAVVAKEKASFLAFLDSVKPASASAP